MIMPTLRAHCCRRSRFRSGCPAPACSGHSLLELTVVLAIAAILAGFAPHLNRMVREERLTTTANALVTDLALTRSEALRRGTPATLCASRDGLQCDPRAAWHEGWIVFGDIDGDRLVGDDEPIIRVQQHLEQQLSLRFSGFGTDYAVRFQSTGIAENNGTFTLCDPRGAAYARAVILNYVGRAYVSRKNSAGDPLKCGG
jgi:type IV fimbrial biogenesis protein FimT